MFREMKRSNQHLPAEEIAAVLNRCTNGVLACAGDDDYPYAVPLSYVYHEEKIYFHSAKSGHKLDGIARNPKVCFAVVDEDTIVSEMYTSLFRSIIIFGQARIAEGKEREDAFWALTEKYSGDQPEAEKRKEIETCTQALIVAIDVDHVTGKEGREYAEARKRG
jgi:nitroimidazol reductase NimA-like FMN-containing flavoprotein (pyridoxamine 5'-phosphate oxidase superfamily)